MALVYKFEEFELNVERLELRRSGVLLKVDALVLRLLRCLARNAGRLVTKDELVDQVWETRVVADNAITVAVARLRKTLGRSRDQRQYVATLYRRGYRLECDVSAIEAGDDAPGLLARPQEPTPPFVGRDRALASLARALTLSRGRSGRACIVIGEPGIGKTCVAEAFAREAAASEVRVAWGYCREAGDTPPLGPWLRVLREVLARTPSGRLEESMGPAAAEVFALLSEQSVPADAAALLDRPLQGPMRHRTFDNLARAFAVAAESAPWLFILEDIHRADAASMEFLGYLLEELRNTRVLVVATTRPPPGRRVGGPATLLLRVLGHSNCERLVLQRLRREHVETYVGAMLADADKHLADAVFAKSEGNPFFMAELSRQLRSADHPDPEVVRVPAAALDLVWQPIASLDVDTRDVLSAAAVLGRSFELARLQAVTEREASELMACLDDALATDLLIAAPGSMTAFAFGHELLRSVLYDALEPAERRRWHLRVSRVLEESQAAGEMIPASELAYHAYSALPSIDPRKTIEHCRAAAAAAAARFASLDVVRYMRHALEALDLIEGASVRLRMNLLHTSALYSRSCDPEECVRALTEILRMAHERGDATQLVRTACMLNVHPGYKPIANGTRELRHALELLGPDDAALRSAALAALASAAPQCYSAARTRALLTEAVPLARDSGNSISLYTALVYKLWALGGPSEPAETAATVQELEQLAREHPKRMPVLPLDLSMFRAVTALQQGDHARALAALDFGGARARGLGKGEMGWQIERSRVIASFNVGQSADVLGALAKLHQTAETHSVLGTAPFCAFDQTVIALELGAEVSIDDAQRSALAFDSSEPPTIWSMKVRALAAAGLADDATSVLQAVPPTALADLPCGAHYLGTLGHLTRAALLLRANDYLAALYPLLDRHPDAFTGHVSFLCDGSVSHLLGAVARALGRPSEAIAHLERGIAMNDRAGLLRCAAEARLELARCLFHEANGTHRSRIEALVREAQGLAQRTGARRVALEAAEVSRLVH
jgi:DNA-binding winged helix-turn-helix (wHTH) protein/tetratricopeptide (TPR) repeat protein